MSKHAARAAATPAAATPATAALAKAGIAHQVHAYEHDPRVRAFGAEAVEQLAA